MLGWLLAVLVRSSFAGTGPWLQQNAPFQHFDAVLLSLLVAYSLSQISNWVAKKDFLRKPLSERNMKRYGQLIEWLLAEAMEAGSLIELSMRNGKTYIGYVADKGENTEIDVDVGLVPVLSGYRDNETHELIIATNYSAVVKQCGEPSGPFAHVSPEQLKVLIPIREIVSARHFDLAVAEYFGQLVPVAPSAS